MKPRLPNSKENNTKNWFVIRTATNAEAKVKSRVDALQLESFLPLYETMRIWSDRKKKVQVPLISSTLFVYCSPEEFSRIYPIPGVNSILKFLGKPAIVHHWEIDNLKILLRELNGNAIDSEDIHFTAGEQVRVVRGPFKGLYGTSVECNGKHRIHITIDAINTGFSVNVPKSFVKKIQKAQVA